MRGGTPHRIRVGQAWLIACAAAVLCTAAGGCRPFARPPADASPTNAAAAWSPERISQDPEGYLRYVNESLQARMAERQENLKAVQKRRGDIDARFAAFASKCGELENLEKRLRNAYRRAEDEDRWPFKVAGREFDREKADAVLAVIRRTLADNQPLLSSYQDASSRLTIAEQALKNDLENLARLADKVRIDQERIGINKGMAELADLKRTEAELASFSQTLVDMGDDLNSGVLATTDAAQRTMEVDKLLK